MKRLLTGLACAAIVISVAAPATWAQDRSVGDRVDDAVITSTLKTKLTADRPKNAVKVDVVTKDGVETLTGTVSTEEQKAEAERLARNTKGVKDVITSGLKVEGAGTSPSASPRK